MANKISRKYIENSAIDGTKLLLQNNQTARAQAPTGESVDLFKYDDSGSFRMIEHPVLPRDPQAALEAATKAYVDARVGQGVGRQWHRESRQLTDQDITNQYVDLSRLADPGSLDCGTRYLILQPAQNYITSIVNGVTRVTFVEDSSVLGTAPLMAGDILWFKYQY